MNLKGLFWNDAGVLRAPWRILFFAAACFAGVIVADGIAGPILGTLFSVIGLRGVSIASWVECLGLLAGTALTLRMVDKRSWRAVWLDSDAARPSLLAFGFMIGALAIGLPILSLVAAHWLREMPGGAGSWVAGAIRVSMLLLPAALLEELLTRGYLLAALVDWWGWTWAVVVTSVGFGLLHLQNNGATVASVTLVTVAGLFLAGVVYTTRSLYAAWMAHFAWNWTMAVLFHASVSGYPLEAPRYQFVDAGPDWATGGEWGPEGGLPAGLGMIGGTAYLLARRTRKPRRADA